MEAKRPVEASISPASFSIDGSSPSLGPSPASNQTSWPSARGISRMSAKTMAASNGKRRIGCRVASAAISGLWQKAMKPPALARSSWYSGSERPAWRMNQIGGRSRVSPASARNSLGVVSLMPSFKPPLTSTLKPRR
jgi:hypothetical protein